MPSKELPKTTNNLKSHLEEGKPIEGIVGWVVTELLGSSAYDDDTTWPVVIKVKCTRVEAGGKKYCGIRIFATPMSGEGEFEVNVCNWFDSVSEFKENFKYQMRVQEADQKMKSIIRSGYITVTRKSLIAFIRSLPEDINQMVLDELISRFELNDKATLETGIRKCTKEVIKQLLPDIVAKHYKVKVDDLCNLRYV